MQIEAVDFEDPRALQEHVLKILRVAGELPKGQLRRDALVEVGRLRKRAIELHRWTSADLKAKIAARREQARLRRAARRRRSGRMAPRTGHTG